MCVYLVSVCGHLYQLRYVSMHIHACIHAFIHQWHTDKVWTSWERFALSTYVHTYIHTSYKKEKHTSTHTYRDIYTYILMHAYMSDIRCTVTLNQSVTVTLNQSVTVTLNQSVTVTLNQSVTVTLTHSVNLLREAPAFHIRKYIHTYIHTHIRHIRKRFALPHTDTETRKHTYIHTCHIFVAQWRPNKAWTNRERCTLPQTHTHIHTYMSYIRCTVTPKQSMDVLREVRACQAKGRPYVCVFVGVNGVGKSTSLSKVCGRCSYL
jgi:hypothetical protein